MVVEKVAKLWSRNDSYPAETGCAIVMVAHGATTKNITHGAYAVVQKAFEINVKNQGKVFFGAFTGSLNSEVEKEIKEAFFPEATYFGEVWSTIQECIAAREAIKKAKLDSKPVIVVTDEAHSRRCGLIWGVLCPYWDIRIISVPLISTIDKDSPMWPYNYAWTVLLFQALTTPLYLLWSLRGKEYLESRGHFHQPTKSTTK